MEVMALGRCCEWRMLFDMHEEETQVAPEIRIHIIIESSEIRTQYC